MRTQRIGRLDIDQPRLLAELEQMSTFVFSDAYSDYLCGGPWKSCMLWSSGGSVGDGLITNYDHDKASAWTEYAERLPYLCGMIERSFHLDHLNFARLAVISNSVIIPHRDLLELGEIPVHARNAHRLHVPLVTNEACYFAEENIVYRMKFAEAWFFDASSIHSAASFSEQSRVHLLLDFADVRDAGKLVKFKPDEQAGIPRDSICSRPKMTEAERASLLSLADVIDLDNFKDVFSLVIKKHYRKDGGPNFIWDTMTSIAEASRNPAVSLKVRELHEYFLLKRSA